MELIETIIGYLATGFVGICCIAVVVLIILGAIWFCSMY